MGDALVLTEAETEELSDSTGRSDDSGTAEVFKAFEREIEADVMIMITEARTIQNVGFLGLSMDFMFGLSPGSFSENREIIKMPPLPYC